MEVTRDVILDLLPMYLADEVSEDTRILVDSYLEKDAKLAAIAARYDEQDMGNNISVPLNEENEMEAYKEAKRSIFWRTIIIAVILATFTLAFACAGLLGLLFILPA